MNSILELELINVELTFAAKNQDIFNMGTLAQIAIVPIIPWVMKMSAEKGLNDTKVQEFIHRNDLHFDLVINEEILHESWLMFGHKFKAPIVTIGKINRNYFHFTREIGLSWWNRFFIQVQLVHLIFSIGIWVCWRQFHTLVTQLYLTPITCHSLNVGATQWFRSSTGLFEHGFIFRCKTELLKNILVIWVHCHPLEISAKMFQ